MKLLFISCILILCCFIHSCKKEYENRYTYEHLVYQDSLYPPITKRNIAVILVDFPDIPEPIKNNFPSVEEARDYFFSPSIKDYFSTISWGKLQFEGQVFGYFTMPDSLKKDYRNNEYIIKTTESYDLAIPDFSTNEYDVVAYIIFHHEYEQGGLSAAGFANFTVNGKRYEKQNVLYLGAWINDTTNTYTRPIQYKIRYGNNNNDVETESHPINWKYNQIIFCHEFIHLMRGDINIPHSNTCTNNGKHDYEPADSVQPQKFLNLNYGNKFDIMGGGSLSLSLNGAYRKLGGWCDEKNTMTLSRKGEKTNCRIYPINRDDGYRLIEVRLFDKELNKRFSEYPGYFLEIREADKWDVPLSNPLLKENTNGFMVYKTDGFTSMLLDMSPSENFIDANNNHFIDYRDMALKPGMMYENDEISLSNVMPHRDGSYSVDIKIK